jgi:hypothetical protein
MYNIPFQTEFHFLFSPSYFPASFLVQVTSRHVILLMDCVHAGLFSVEYSKDSENLIALQEVNGHAYRGKKRMEMDFENLLS